MRVVVRERRPAAHRPEALERRWVLRANTPPPLQALADTVARVGVPFHTRLSAAAADGDLAWTPSPADTGRVPFRVRVDDGLDSAVGTSHLLVLPAAARPVADAPILRVWPNPFSRWESLQWEVAAPCRDPAPQRRRGAQGGVRTGLLVLRGVSTAP